MLTIPTDKIKVHGGSLHPKTEIKILIRLEGPLVYPTLCFDNHDLFPVRKDGNDDDLELMPFNHKVIECKLDLSDLLDMRGLLSDEGAVNEDVFSTLAELAFLKSLKCISFSIEDIDPCGTKGVRRCLVDFRTSRHKIDAILEGVDIELGQTLAQYFKL